MRERNGGGDERAVIVFGLLEVLDEVRDLLDEAVRIDDRGAAAELANLMRSIAATIDRLRPRKRLVT